MSIYRTRKIGGRNSSWELKSEEGKPLWLIRIEGGFKKSVIETGGGLGSTSLIDRKKKKGSRTTAQRKERSILCGNAKGLTI